MKRWMVALSIVLVVVLVGGAGYLGSRSMQGEGSVAPSPPRTIPVTRGDVLQVVAAPGQIVSAHQVALGMGAGGELIEVAVRPGDHVKAGDVLACIDPAPLERAAIQAEANLTVAQTDLEKARDPYTDLDLIQARLAVAQAEVELREAQENLEEAQAPPTELELAEAKQAVSQAEVDLADAEEKLETLLNPYIGGAQAAVRDATAALEIAKNQLIAVENDTQNAAKLRTLEDEAGWYRNHYQLSVRKHEKGEISKKKLDWEYLNMVAAEEKLTAAKAKAEAALTSAQSLVTKAEETLGKAQQKLAALQNGPDPLEVERAEDRVVQAEHNLVKDRDDLAKMEAGTDPDDVKVIQAQTRVAQAEYNLAKAQDNLAKMEAGADPNDVKVAQARLASAQAELEEAREAWEAATLTAPFDGVVLEVNAVPGDRISAGTMLVTLMDPSAVEARVTVIEEDLPLIEIGQGVELFVDALPDASLHGHVARIIPQSTPGDSPRYPVYISLDDELPAVLAPGMTVDASIVSAERKDVLTLPRALVRARSDGTAQVKVWVVGQIEERAVRVGLRGGLRVEIVEGLREGEQVVAE